MRFISATQIFNGTKFLNADTVLVLDDNNQFIESVSKASLNEAQIEKHEGIICPGFVNAHCHVELSYLYQHIQQKTGFTGFASELMSKRFAFSQEEIEKSIIEAEEKMWNNGIVAVGDISNNNSSFGKKAGSKMHYHTFIELISFNPDSAEKVFAAGKELQEKLVNQSGTLAPHAPYSVSAALMKKTAEACPENKPLTIHNQESSSENEFFVSGTGNVLDLYKNLNIDIPYFQASGKSSLQTYLKNLPANRNLILVHNTFTTVEDIKFAEDYSHKIYWCLCPNANLFIENSLPDVKLFTSGNCKMVIGTDSLASNHSLSIVDELNTLIHHFSWLETGDLLKWATSNGAKALNMEDKAGGFIKGKNAGLNLIDRKLGRFEYCRKLA